MAAEPTDSELLSQWQQTHSEPAFRALVARYAGLVHRAALRTSGGDDALATEAAQLTFITLAGKARALAGRDSLAGWLHVTSTHQARNLVRLRQREARKLESLGRHLETMSTPDPLADWKKLAPELDAAIAGLGHKDRETLLMRYYRAFSVQEIAATLSISMEAAQKRLERATERLRQRLGSSACGSASALSAALLAGMADDAQASAALAGPLASHALKAAPAAGATAISSLLTTLLMKKTLLAAVIVLAIGTTALVMATKAPHTPPPAPATTRTHAPAGGLAPVEKSGSAESVSQRELKRLAATYGEDRTRKSQAISDTAIAFSEKMFSLVEPFYRAGESTLTWQSTPQTSMLNLKDTQTERANQVVREFMGRQMREKKDALKRLAANPWPLVELTLAADACARGEMSKDSYHALRAASAADFGAVENPVGEDLSSLQFGSVDPLTDPAFVEAFRALLDEGPQREAFDQKVAESKKPAQGDRMLHTFANLEPMSLDQLQKQTEGILQVIEALEPQLQGLKPQPIEDEAKKDGQESGE